MDVGDVYDADLNEDRRRRVLVISPARFNRLAGRAVVTCKALVSFRSLGTVDTNAA